MTCLERRRWTVLSLALAVLIVLASSAGAAFAQTPSHTSSPDLSQYVVPPEEIGDDWSIASQASEPSLFRAGYSPPAVAGYVVTYGQGEQAHARIALYAFPDHAGALASLKDPAYYWGHGDTTLVPLDGLGDDQSYRAYGVGAGPTSGITFVDGAVVVYVRAADDAASDTSGVDAICDALAAAEDALLQATPGAAQPLTARVSASL